MSFFETCLDECRVHRGIRGEDGRQVRVNTDIRDDHVQVRGLDYASDNGFNLRNVVVAYLDARAAGHADVDHKLARVGSREVGAPKKWKEQSQDQNDAPKNARGSEARPPHGALRQTFIPVEHGLELLVKLALEAGEKAYLLRVFLFVLQVDEVGAEERHHRHRKEVRRKDRKHHAQSERSKYVLADP